MWHPCQPASSDTTARAPRPPYSTSTTSKVSVLRACYPGARGPRRGSFRAFAWRRTLAFGSSSFAPTAVRGGARCFSLLRRACAHRMLTTRSAEPGDRAARAAAGCVLRTPLLHNARRCTQLGDACASAFAFCVTARLDLIAIAPPLTQMAYAAPPMGAPGVQTIVKKVVTQGVHPTMLCVRRIQPTRRAQPPGGGRLVCHVLQQL